LKVDICVIYAHAAVVFATEGADKLLAFVRVRLLAFGNDTLCAFGAMAFN
jgi:hypothetical protein